MVCYGNDNLVKKVARFFYNMYANCVFVDISELNVLFFLVVEQCSVTDQ